MAESERDVVLNFRMDGQVQYAETLKQINMVMNTAAKEYKNHIAAMGRDASATDKLRAEKKKLEIQLEGAQKRTSLLRREYEAMANDTSTTSDELTRMYGRLLDAERAETNFSNSLQRVSDGLSDEAIAARDAKEVLEGLKDESKLLDAEQRNLASSFRLQQSELGANATEAEKAELAQRQLTEQMDLSERAVSNLERQLEQAKRVYGENSVEVIQLGTRLNDARSTISNFRHQLEGIGDSGDIAGDGLEELGNKMDLNNLMEATELLQGVTDKLLEVGKAAMDSAFQFGDSQTNLQANLGLTADQAEELNKIVGNVFKNGVVGSVEEATEAVKLVKGSFKDLNDSDLEKLTNKITTISKRTGTDVSGNILAAQKMMSSFGLSGEQAMDLITAGYQNGLNKSDDFLDTLNEYSPHFKAAGYSANQMLQVIKNGMENGAMNTDKAADAVKEFQIRLGDGSFEKIMGGFSKDTQGMFKKWQDGKATVADVAGSVSKDLNKMTPTEQQKALSILSSQFEDLGVDGAAALFSVGDAFKDTTGKADEMSKKSPGEKWESSLRELQSSLLPIGQQLVDGLTPVIDGLTKVGDWFEKLPGPVQTFITVFGGVLVVAAALTPIIIGLVVAIGSLDVALLPIIAIVVGVAAAIAGVILVIQHWGAITDWIGAKWDQFTSWLSKGTSDLSKSFVKGFNDMKDGAVDKFNSLRDKAGSVMEQAKNKILSPIESAKDKISGIVDKIKGFFTGLKLKIPTPSMPKLPHFSIETSSKSIMGKKITYPTGFEVDWRAKGGIFTEPTIFGMGSNGKLQGGGEAGPEAAIPLNDETLGAIGKGIANTMQGANGNVEIHVYLDTEEVNTKLAPGMSRKINQSNKINARGRGVIFT